MAFTTGTTAQSDVPINSVSIANSTTTASRTGTTTTRRTSKGTTTAAQNNADPWNLISAKTTAGHKATWDGGLGHYKYA